LTPLEYLSAHHDRSLGELIEFVRIPSVSTDPQRGEDVARAAQWVAAQMRQAGPIDVRIVPTPGHPVIYGEWLGAPSAPTLLVYGHYDVQPPDPIERWLSDPFEPVVRDGRVYGRGVSDNKGPMLIPIKVAQAFFATRGALPLNVKFIFEGEEEIGSRNLEPFLAAKGQLLQADCVLSADGAMWRHDDHDRQPWCGRAGIQHHGREQEPALGPLRRLDRERAARHGRAGRQPAFCGRPRRRRGFL